MTLLLLIQSTQTDCLPIDLKRLTNGSFCFPYSYLETQHDIDVLIRGLKLTLRLTRTEPLLSAFVASETNPLLDHQLHEADDKQLEDQIRKRAETVFHPACTARMARMEDGGVVDAYLRVHGIENLRVVDASVFPTITSGHTVSSHIIVSFICLVPDFGGRPHR